jgi:TRAP-type C4-dicarboxylate transport system permease small subunit
MITRERLWRATLQASRLMALIGFFGLLVLALMTTCDILSRWLFNHPIDGVNDVSAVVMAVVIAACLPANLAERQNITVEFLGNALGRRGKAILDSLGSLITLIFVALVAWRFIPYSIEITTAHQTTWVLKLPVAPAWWIATALLLLSVPVQFMVFVSNAARACAPAWSAEDDFGDLPSHPQT